MDQDRKSSGPAFVVTQRQHTGTFLECNFIFKGTISFTTSRTTIPETPRRSTTLSRKFKYGTIFLRQELGYSSSDQTAQMDFKYN